MKEDKRPDNIPAGDQSPLREKANWKPASRSTRIKAWIGIVAMILLTIGYFYVFYSGTIIHW